MDARPARPLLEASTIVLAVVGAAALAAPHLHVAPGLASALVFGGVALVAIVGAFVATRAPLPGRAALLVVAGAAAALVVLAFVRPPPLVAAPLVDLALVLAGAAIGGAIGARIEHPGHLLPASIVAASADVISVLSPHGPTHTVASDERALSLLALSFPVPGTTFAAPALGVGDVLFVALLLSAARAHALSPVRVAALAAVGIALSGAASAMLDAAVPALPAIVAAVLVGVPGARRLRRKDRTVALVASGIAVALAAAVVVGRVLPSGWGVAH